MGEDAKEKIDEAKGYLSQHLLNEDTILRD